MTETWKPIDFIEGIDADRYEVSDHGRVRSLCNSWRRRSTPKILTTNLNTGGYLKLTLCQHARGITVKTHRLVATAFIPNPEGKPHVAHNDGIKTNNHVSNLRWATRVENEADKFAHGTDSRGERNANAKLTETCVRKIRARHAAGGVFQMELAEEFGVTPSVISNIIHRKRWTHVPDTGASR